MMIKFNARCTVFHAEAKFSRMELSVKKVTGTHAHDYIVDNIAKPLCMKDTSFDLTPDMAKRSIIFDKDQEKYFNSVINGTYKPRWIGEKLRIPSTGGGLKSTAYDLNRFGNMALYGGTFNNTRILGRKAMEKMTTKSLHNIPDYCWGVNQPDRGYGIGFDMRSEPSFIYSPGTFCHEGAGACALYIDPKEELVAAWFVPYKNDAWYSELIWNVVNIIWSGLI